MLLNNITVDAIMDHLNERFVDHIPESKRRTYVKVDQRPGNEGVWLMPEGVPATMPNWENKDGIYYAKTDKPVSGVFPIAEIMLPDGTIYRLE